MKQNRKAVSSVSNKRLIEAKTALTIKIFFAKKPPLYTEMCGNIIR